MSMWRVIQAVCLLGMLSGVTHQASYYDDVVTVKLMDSNYGNEINVEEQPETETDTEATPTPCLGPELTKWDKLFTMLENSQMKENMLLQHSDDLVRVELQALRSDVVNIAAQYNGACSASSESHARRVELQLQHAADRLASDLQDVVANVQELNRAVRFYLQGAHNHPLPSGCDMTLLFPMRSSKSYAEVNPEASMQTDALSVCMWVKPTQVLDKAVLFSYSTNGNPLELQLLLSGRSALFTVGGEAHLVEAQDAAQEGEWTHLCATWESEHGMAALWVNGHEDVRSPGVAEGHRLLSDGTLILGHEHACKAKTSRFGLQKTSEPGLAFAGKMTGVNVWSRVLREDEIYQQAQYNGRGCGARGNLVAWGVSEISRSENAELIF